MFDTHIMSKRAMRLLGDGVALSLAVTIGGYFYYAATAGDYGAEARAKIHAKQVILKSEVAAITHQADAMADKSKRLSDGYLDLDLLDEEIRAVLGYIGPGEFLLPAE